jgi:hypothetical protein
MRELVQRVSDLRVVGENLEFHAKRHNSDDDV